MRPLHTAKHDDVNNENDRLGHLLFATQCNYYRKR
jgi:hypothetical protein